MKQFFFIPVIFFHICIFAQDSVPTVHLSRLKLISEVPAVTDEVADHSLRIADTLLNSLDFKEALAKMDFRSDNTCKDCDSNGRKRDPRIGGQEVLNKL